MYSLYNSRFIIDNHTLDYSLWNTGFNFNLENDNTNNHTLDYSLWNTGFNFNLENINNESLGYSLWNTGFNFNLENENTNNIVFGDFHNEEENTDNIDINKITNINNKSSIQDVYNWIISLNMKRSVLIANCFKDEEIDGEVLLTLTHDDVNELFIERNLGRLGLFWLAILKQQNV